MTYRTFRWSAMIGAAMGSLAAAAPVLAQGWHYPSFTPPRVQTRELSLGVAGDGDAGTVLVGQWREGITPTSELMFDLGFASPNHQDTHVLLGGAYGYQLSRATTNQPLDALLTVGIYGAFGNPLNLVRIPIGVSIGHRFPLKGQMAITPYVHPRVSFDFFSGQPNISDKSNVTINFDIGGNLELTPQLSLRASILVAGGNTFSGDNTGFGLALAYRPPGLR
ncbi:MAG TPA: hypothetical protein VFW98_07840 [Gemmatimonadaceae bacterium]|nr:hypothetical protein [Gemmatimonadaceae bacterium]